MYGCTQFSETQKHEITRAHILAIPNMNKPFRDPIDAIHIAVGRTLTQLGGNES